MDDPDILEIDSDAGELPESALRTLRDGGLVAFPTETVYGLGADASDGAAVERIFRAKRRPSGHPLIVHVDGPARARQIAGEWPSEAGALAEYFWPGPLTVIVERSEEIAPETTGGLPTVGIRCPGHPVARGLVRRSGLPIAAPSANVHQGVSPTRAEHVVRSLGGSVDVVLDAGPTDIGIESTVLSLAGDAPTILRPGMVDRAQLAGLLGEVEYADEVDIAPDDARPSPGLGERHYAPGAAVRLREPAELLRDEPTWSGREDVGWMVRSEKPPVELAGEVRVLPGPVDSYARELYGALHALDAVADRIVVEPPPRNDRWRAVWNRLDRAASGSASAHS